MYIIQIFKKIFKKILKMIAAFGFTFKVKKFTKMKLIKILCQNFLIVLIYFRCDNYKFYNQYDLTFKQRNVI